MTAFINSSPKVTVLLASYQGLPWIDEQIDSIFQQQNVNIELTISDDLSDDGTIDFLYQKKLTHSLKLMPAKRSGTAALNFFRLLIESDFSEADYVALSDQDDIWLPNKLDGAIQSIKKQNAEGYSSNVRAFWSDGRTKLINKAQPQQVYDYMFESAGPGCTFVMSQRLAIELQKFLKSHILDCHHIALHDWFIYAFARSRNYKWYIDSTPGLLYRQHEVNAFGANSGLKAIISRLKKLNQGWYTQQIVTIARVLNYQNMPPLQKICRLNICDRVFLIIASYQFRRRLRDRFVFAFFIFFLARKP